MVMYIGLYYYLQLHVMWSMHFYNEYQRKHGFLSRIEDHDTPSDILFEDRIGYPPHSRSQEAITNVNGITAYQVETLVDRKGGATIRDPIGAWADMWNIVVSTSFSRLISTL